MSRHYPDTPRSRAHTAGQETQHGVLVITVAAIGAMLLVSALLAMSTGQNGREADWGVGVASFLLFVAAAAVGAALGFLFGLPRSRFTDQLANHALAASGASGSTSHYLANSNLIKVSDWLTTIVIGLGLVNLGNAVPGLRTLAAALQEPLGGAPYAGAVGVSMLLGGSIGGFMLGYVYTSIRLRQLLEDSDRQTETVPHLAGMSLEDAERSMSATGLRLAVEPDAANHRRVARQEPTAGERLPLGSTVAVELHPEPSDDTPRAMVEATATHVSISTPVA